MKKQQKLHTAIIGSGNIGTDLLIKLQRSELLDCTLFVGRNSSSNGINLAKKLKVRTEVCGIDSLLNHADQYELVFDATSALFHNEYAPVLKKLGKRVINMTPAKIGKMCVPVLNIQEVINEDNINMITCGGQVAVPIAYALSTVHKDIKYIEIVSSIASKSAGPATRLNIDEYIVTTERAITKFSGCNQVKAILNINPAEPGVCMKTTVFAEINVPNMDVIKSAVKTIVESVQCYVQGYELLVAPWFDGSKVMVMITVKGNGDYLPVFAGNLDIITCAAIQVGEAISKHMLSY